MTQTEWMLVGLLIFTNVWQYYTNRQSSGHRNLDSAAELHERAYEMMAEAVEHDKSVMQLQAEVARVPRGADPLETAKWVIETARAMSGDLPPLRLPSPPGSRIPVDDVDETNGETVTSSDRIP